MTDKEKNSRADEKQIIEQALDIMLDNPKIAKDADCLVMLFWAASSCSTPGHPIEVIKDEHLRKIPARTLIRLCDKYISQEGVVAESVRLNLDLVVQSVAPMLVACPGICAAESIRKIILADRLNKGQSECKKIMDHLGLASPSGCVSWMDNAAVNLSKIPKNLWRDTIFFVLELFEETPLCVLEQRCEGFAKKLDEAFKEAGKENIGGNDDKSVGK
jgi:hypothetical protein